jgi:hypothetical protein
VIEPLLYSRDMRAGATAVPNILLPFASKIIGGAASDDAEVMMYKLVMLEAFLQSQESCEDMSGRYLEDSIRRLPSGVMRRRAARGSSARRVVNEAAHHELPHHDAVRVCVALWVQLVALAHFWRHVEERAARNSTRMRLLCL